MQELRYTLLADGSSDRALLPILTWRSSAHRVAEMIDDFRPLYGLAAFQWLAAEVERVATAEEWH